MKIQKIEKEWKIHIHTAKITKLHTVQIIVVGVSLNATLANPKSHILSLQLALNLDDRHLLQPNN